MTKYHANFSIVGQVTEMLVPESDIARLLIDISAKPDGDQDTPHYVYRTSFTVLESNLIEEMQSRVSLGDVIEATGSFWQTGYVPHRTTYIDTTFRLSRYRLIQKRAVSVIRYGPYHSNSLSQAIH
jgi:hypothetical protein